MNFKKSWLILIIFLLAAAGCGGDESGDESPGDPADDTSAEVEPAATNTPGPIAQSAQAGSFFAINEVGLGPDGFVALTNFTDVAVSLEGLYLCQGSECFALPSAVVDGGETVTLTAGDGAGLENVVATEAAFGELRPPDGEIALFSSNRIDDPESLLIYFQWGSTPHETTEMAIEAGLWVEGGYGPSGDNATRLFRNLESGLWLWE